MRTQEASNALKRTFGRDGDTALTELYKSVGSSSTLHKINLLESKLGGSYNFYAMGGVVTDDTRLACLEHEYLRQINKIDLLLA